eukprot:COSAG01_NODE_517_length_16020_cov_42.983167_7_plen_83_part_00
MLETLGPHHHFIAVFGKSVLWLWNSPIVHVSCTEYSCILTMGTRDLESSRVRELGNFRSEEQLHVFPVATQAQARVHCTRSR